MSELKAAPRTQGIKPKQMRKQGLLPMALVQRDTTTIPLQTTVDDLKRATAHIDGLGRMDLRIEGEPQARKVILKQVDKDYIRQELIHLTVQEVTEDDTMKIDVTVIASGTPVGIGENESAVLIQATDTVTLRGKLSQIPETVQVDVSDLGLDGSISASDLNLPDGVELMSSGDATLFSLTVVKEQVLEPELPQEGEVAEGEESVDEVESGDKPTGAGESG
jgi:large subunit ribosomal protein L25